MIGGLKNLCEKPSPVAAVYYCGLSAMISALIERRYR
jgi:hypothetical protein